MSSAWTVSGKHRFQKMPGDGWYAGWGGARRRLAAQEPLKRQCDTRSLFDSIPRSGITLVVGTPLRRQRLTRFRRCCSASAIEVLGSPLHRAAPGRQRSRNGDEHQRSDGVSQPPSCLDCLVGSTCETGASLAVALSSIWATRGNPRPDRPPPVLSRRVRCLVRPESRNAG